jgi:hypothetical protein
MVLLAAAAVLAGITAYAITMRVPYPFELEWMEGEMVVHVTRLMHGQPLYVGPTLAFVPFGYPPLYYYVSLAVASFIDGGFLPLRIVSIASTVITLAAIIGIVRPVSGWIAGIAAAASYSCTYPATDARF